MKLSTTVTGLITAFIAITSDAAEAEKTSLRGGQRELGIRAIQTDPKNMISGCPSIEPSRNDYCDWPSNQVCPFDAQDCCGTINYATLASCQNGKVWIANPLIVCAKHCDEKEKQVTTKALRMDSPIGAVQSGPKNMSVRCPSKEPHRNDDCDWPSNQVCPYDAKDCHGTTNYATLASCQNGKVWIANPFIGCTKDSEEKEKQVTTKALRVEAPIAADPTNINGTCPSKEPKNNDDCSWPRYQVCPYEAYDCCGVTNYATLAKCQNGKVWTAKPFVGCPKNC